MYLQTDVLDVALDMRRAFFAGAGDRLAPDEGAGHGEGAGGRAFFVPDEEGDGDVDGWQGAGWLQVNPLGTPTEREMLVEEAGDPVYRLLLVKRR